MPSAEPGDPTPSLPPTAEAAAADAHLRVDDIAADLRSRTIRSGVLQMVAQGVQLLLLVGSALVLARLLTPDDFGVAAMVSTVAALVMGVRDFGFPFAAVQREALDQRNVSALFWLSVRLNLLLSAGTMVLAPLLARFYGEPRVLLVTIVWSVGSFFGSVTALHEGLLVRRMRFAALRVVEIGSLVVGIAVGIALAWMGFGYWALVYQTFVGFVARAVLAWFVTGWRPTSFREVAAERGRALRALLHYGRDVTGARLLTFVSQNTDQLVVGRAFGAAALGLYDNAYRWSLYPAQQVFLPLSHVAISALSRLQGSPGIFRSAFRQAVLPYLAVSVPGFVFLVIQAEVVIPALLGERWRGAVPFFRVLCLAALVRAYSRPTSWLYLSEGRTRPALHFAALSTPLMLAAVIAGARWGAIGVAYGFTLGTLLLTLPEIAWCLRGSRVRASDFVAACWRPTLAALAAGAALVAALPRMDALGRWPLVLASLAVFGVAYVATWLVLPGGWRTTRELAEFRKAMG